MNYYGSITEFPFENNDAIIEKLKLGEGLVRVTTNIFGRKVSVELEPTQIRLAE